MHFARSLAAASRRSLEANARSWVSLDGLVDAL
jgi:hypothetical protein